MTKLFSTFLLLAALTGANAQATQPVADPPYIEVTGTAEKFVIPDIIYIAITLRDKVVNKDTYTIAAQEAKLKSALQGLGIDLKNLSLTGASTDIIKYKRKDRGVEEVKEYELKVSSAADVSRVFEALHNIEVKEANIARTDHSQMDALRKEVRINAMKAAKEKATYLLQAIGEEPGKPLIVREELLSGRSNFSNLSVNATFKEESPEMQYESMQLKFSYYVKYSIK